MRRRNVGGIAVLAIAGLLAGVAPGAAAVDDPEAARRAAQDRRAEVTDEIDTLTATEGELEAELAALATRIGEQRKELDRSKRAAEAAEEEHEKAKAEVAATVAAIRQLKALVVDRAITEFMAPPTFDMEAFIEANDIGQASRLKGLLNAVAENDHNAVELLEAAERQLEAQEEAAAEAAATAVEERESAARTLKDLETTKARQDEVKRALEARIEAFKQEADALAAEEEELTRIIAERAAEQRRIEAERAAAEQRRIEADRAAAAARGRAPAPAPSPASAPASSGRLGFPAAGRVSSEFGRRWGRLHAGIDIAAPTGTPIHAATGGTVYFVGPQGGYGNTVLIDHGGGLTTLYAHQSRFATSVGARVERGQLIGYVGNTGNSTGPHLHFETRVNGAPQNPRIYL